MRLATCAPANADFHASRRVITPAPKNILPEVVFAAKIRAIISSCLSRIATLSKSVSFATAL